MGALYPVEIEESLIATPEEVMNRDVYVSDLHGEVDWDLTGLKGVPNSGNRVSSHIDYECSPEMGTVATDSVPPSVPDVLWLATFKVGGND